MFRSQPELALPKHSIPEQRRRDPPVTFLVHLAACRPVAVDRALPAWVRRVVLVRWAVAALGHRAERVRLQLVVRSAVAAAVVAQAAAAAEQTRSMR